MNENTTKLLEKLAEKMGTTSEYLWSILLKQAPISATITLAIYAIVAIYGIILFKHHKKFSKKQGEGQHSRTIYEDSEPTCVGMIIATFVFAVACIGCLVQINNLINGYFNPQYWALQKILDAI